MQPTKDGVQRGTASNQAGVELTTLHKRAANAPQPKVGAPSDIKQQPAVRKPGFFASRFAFVRNALVGYHDRQIIKAERQEKAAQLELALGSAKMGLAEAEMNLAKEENKRNRKEPYLIDEHKNKIKFYTLVIDMLRDKQKLNTEHPSASVQAHLEETLTGAKAYGRHYNEIIRNALFGRFRGPSTVHSTGNERPIQSSNLLKRTWRNLKSSPRDQIIHKLPVKEKAPGADEVSSKTNKFNNAQKQFEKVYEVASGKIQKAIERHAHALENERAAHLNFLGAVAAGADTATLISPQAKDAWITVLSHAKEAKTLMEKAFKLENTLAQPRDKEKFHQLSEEILKLKNSAQEHLNAVTPDSFKSIESDNSLLSRYIDTTKAHLMSIAYQFHLDSNFGSARPDQMHSRIRGDQLFKEIREEESHKHPGLLTQKRVQLMDLDRDGPEIPNLVDEPTKGASDLVNDGSDAGDDLFGRGDLFG